jgi:PDZ domain-containing protein
VEVSPVGTEVVLVQPGTPAEGELEVGDVIVAAAGEDVETITDLRSAMTGIEPGEPVELTVERGEEGEELELTVSTVASEQAPDRAVVGVQVQDAEDFEFPVDVDIEAPGIGGPSAGLAFALDIVDELRGDLTRGRKVVVTGELGLDGSVMAIGGIKQKTVGARRADADIFLVPRANVAEAREVAKGLTVIPVSTFEEALRYLERE